MEGFIFLVMIVISIIGWISNAANENKKKGQLGDGQQRPQKKRKLQDELESFLSELQGEKPKQQRKPQRQTERPQESRKKRRPLAESKQDSLPSQQRRSSNRQKNRSSKTQAPRKRVAREEPHSVFEDDASHQVGSGNLGQGLKDHVEAYSDHHPGTLIDELEKKSFSKLAAPKRSSGGVSSTSLSASGQAIDLLHSADSIRTAIVLNEILQPPVSQRPGRL